ncbi:MAG TPA: lamin tail domain-containing protein, partial [Candidatus Saccharimonadales bacterium]|nr:lamin tail domain-containing protein [Candidatus Saccharimonadales bacterium]
MKRVGLVIGLITSIMLLIPTDAYAQAGAPDILIVELQVRGSGTTGAADQEFAELYNVTELPIDMSSWKLQYKSATGTTWSDKVTLHGILASHSRFLLVSDKFTGTPTTGTDGSPLGIDTFSAGFSDSAGHIRIINNTIPTVPDVHDTLGWGTTANAAEGNAPATAPGGGKSLKRNVDADGNFVDTNNNAADFALSTEPSPQADPLYIVPPVDETPPPDPALEPDPNPAPDPIQTPPPASEDPAVEQPATEPET